MFATGSAVLTRGLTFVSRAAVVTAEVSETPDYNKRSATTEVIDWHSPVWLCFIILLTPPGKHQENQKVQKYEVRTTRFASIRFFRTFLMPMKLIFSVRGKSH